jgi:DNA-binding transcriptional MocR family regulator
MICKKCKQDKPKLNRKGICPECNNDDHRERQRAAREIIKQQLLQYSDSRFTPEHKKALAEHLRIEKRAAENKKKKPVFSDRF